MAMFPGLPGSYGKNALAAIGANKPKAAPIISGSFNGFPASYTRNARAAAGATLPRPMPYDMSPAVKGSPIPKGYATRAREAAYSHPPADVRPMYGPGRAEYIRGNVARSQAVRAERQQAARAEYIRGNVARSQAVRAERQQAARRPIISAGQDARPMYGPGRAEYIKSNVARSQAVRAERQQAARRPIISAAPDTRPILGPGRAELEAITKKTAPRESENLMKRALGFVEKNPGKSLGIGLGLAVAAGVVMNRRDKGVRPVGPGRY